MNYCKCIDVKHNTPAAVPNGIILGLGDFDGFHLAHRELLARVKTEAKKNGVPSGIWCFASPCYKKSLNDKNHFLLTLPNERIDFLQNIGIDYLFIADFDTCRDLSPATYVEDVLIRECHCIGTVCGFNFLFGRNRVGTPGLLERYFPGHSVVIDEIRGQTGVISASSIRTFLSEGKIKEANQMLGYEYALHGPVIHGLGNGKTFGYPTANLSFPDDKFIPAFGVYYTHCFIDGKEYDALTDVGTKPTVTVGQNVICESFLIFGDGDLYGKEMLVRFVDYVRPEMKFSSIDALVNRIRMDVDSVIHRKGQI